jgi:ABC-type dipeptide/oligopeptide/nickel transport system permease component
VAAVVFSVINFLVDLLYDRIDPRLASEPAYS